MVAQIRHNLGLDKPCYVQYYGYMKALVLHFDFGYSYQNNTPVRTLIFARLPATISLTVGAAIIWLVLGLAVGIVSAVKRRSKFDRARDGQRAGLDLGARLLARAGQPVPVRLGHRQVHDLPGRGQLRPR